MTDNTFYISECFHSIQGEGNYSGVNSFFIRFHFCNLTCSWCDTKYTWQKKSGIYKEFSKEGIIELIKNNSSNHIIFTGGEPSIYRLDLIANTSKKYHVETNGTIIPSKPLDITLADGTRFCRDAMNEEIVSKFNWVVSPKLQNAGQSDNSVDIAYWNEKEWCTFKFVIETENELDEVDSLVNKYNIDKNRIYIAIEGTTLESQIKPAVIDEIIKRKYNYSPRLQVILWGSRRGK